MMTADTFRDKEPIIEELVGPVSTVRDNYYRQTCGQASPMHLSHHYETFVLVTTTTVNLNITIKSRYPM
jgi:hypothetical protein